MSRFIPQEILNDIKDRADILDVISSYLQLKKSGGRWKGLCPFHHEKTPSFFVNPDAQAFHCFGCGKGGNVFSFVMEKENVDFLEAAHILADKYNIFIPETKAEESGDNKKDERERLYKLHELAAELNSKYLKSEAGKPGLEYLLNRGITESQIDKFQLGFAPDSWDYMIRQAKVYNYSEQELLDSGLIVSKENSSSRYDRFRNRVIFPIWNERGKIIGFSARTIENDPKGGKYVNSPETPIFKKSKVLYALPFARKVFPDLKTAILCEGQLDVIALHSAGFMNAVAPQGTAFTEEQASLLKRYVNRIIICFDGDTAGVNAALKTIEILLPLNFSVKVITLPVGEDPDTIIKNHGKEKLIEYIDNASESFDFLLDQVSKDEDIHTPYGKNIVIEKILNIICKIDNTVLRSSYVSLISQRLSVPESAITTELNKLLRAKKKSDLNVHSKKPKNEKKKSEPVSIQVIKAEEQLLELVILHGDTGRRLEEELPPDTISDSVLGKALNKAISLTMNGDWEHIQEELTDMLTETPDKTLSRILTMPNTYTETFDYNKAATDSINKLKKFYLDKEITEMMNKFRNITDIEQKKEIFKEITRIQKEKLKLS